MGILVSGSALAYSGFWVQFNFPGSALADSGIFDFFWLCTGRQWITTSASAVGLTPESILSELGQY